MEPTDPSLVWLREGSGCPWLLLHGFTGGPDSWRPVVDLMAPGPPLLAAALPGHASGPGVSAGFEANAAALVAAVRNAGVERARVAGYSLGARTALGILATAPALVDRLLLIGVHPGLTSDRDRDSRRAGDAELAGLLRRDGVAAFVDRWEQAPLFASQRRVAPELLAAQRALRLRQSADGLARSLEEMGLAEMPDYRGLLASPAVAIHLLTGARDGKFTALARELAGPVRHQVVPHAGHNLLLEAPAAVASALERMTSP